MKKLVIIVVLILIAGGVAFATLGGMSWLDSTGLRGQERLLKGQIEAYWQARIDQDMETMAEFEHPLSDGVADAGMLVTDSYSIDRIEVNGDEALSVVKLVTHIKHPLLSGRTREVNMRDIWVRYEGEWYRDVHPTSFSDIIKSAEENRHPEMFSEQSEP